MLHYKQCHGCDGEDSPLEISFGMIQSVHSGIDEGRLKISESTRNEVNIVSHLRTAEYKKLKIMMSGHSLFIALIRNSKHATIDHINVYVYDNYSLKSMWQ